MTDHRPYPGGRTLHQLRLWDGCALLAKGCALALSGDVFTVKDVASTLLAQANIMIWRHGKDSFRILFDVSLSDYLWHWLKGAAAEFVIAYLPDNISGC
ncbi:MAG: hypothetical protein COA81_12675 [Alphaproteobacteria bacterium]|nr:MAG: hypothetical protein COA81_12675 [Alphaproteobacteria bacterium]